jgi:phthiocerol/phenolphthiocerol synthesis type-I polyketide synthase C
MSGAGGKVAIIGHACRLPGGVSDPDGFWKLLIEGVDAVTTLPADRFEIDRFLHPEIGARGKSYTFAAGTLGDVAGFDAEFFGISAREAAQMDPQQRLLLELAWEALERAGQPPSRTAGSDCAVYVGISGSDYAERRMGDLENTDPYFMLGSTLSIAANRISYALDLRGPSMAVDTACSSSLVAMHEAVQALQGGRAGMALVGGVNLLLSPAPFVGFASAGMLSPEGRCRAFGAASEGYVRAEGGGVVVLKRLEDAERDGDPILAVIEAIGVNSDGRTHGISLPSSTAQAALLRRVYRQARISPREVSYVEAHGTGTRVGDPAEAAAISAALGARRPKSCPLLIGSAKSNVGHLEPAAGIVGVIKAIEVLRHGMVPPSLHLEELNPEITFDALNLRPVRAATPLPDPRRAVVGVNSFGFGGANAHVILRAHPREPVEGAAVTAHPPLPLVVSGRTDAALAAAVQRMDAYLAAPDAAWRDIAYTACQRRAHHPHRLLIRAADTAGARELLARHLGGPSSTHEAGAAVGLHPKVGLVFVGNGSQWDGMGRRLLAEDDVFRQTVERVDSVARWRLGWSPLQVMDLGAEGMADTRVAQPLLFALQVGLVESLKARGLNFHAVVGHSVGEVAAAYVSGALNLEQAAELIKERSQAQSRTRGHGRMMIASLPLDEAQEAIEPYAGAIEIAAVNSPRGVTLSGDAVALCQLAAELEARGVVAKMLELDYAFHSASQDAVREQVARGLASLAPRAPALPFYSTVTGARVGGAELDGEYWWRNIRDPVRFDDAVAAMAADGIQIFLEVGPQPQLQGYLRQALSHRRLSGQPVATMSRTEAGAAGIQRAVDRVFLAGGEVDFASAFPDGGGAVGLPTYPWQRERCWYEPSPEAGLSFSSRTQGPLLGLRVAPGIDTWEQQIDLGTLPWLADHVLNGAPVMPAAGFVEMALEAGALLFPGRPIEVEAMEIHRPMAMEARKSLMARLSWSAADHIFAIESRPRLQKSGWITHVTGRLATGTAPEKRPAEPWIAATEAVSREDHYAFTAEHGFAYGPRFAVVQGLRATPDRSEAELDLVEPASEGIWLPPPLLDGLLQTVFPMLRARAERDGDELGGTAFVPHKIGRLTFSAAGRGPWRGEARITGGSRRSVTVDGRLLDADGAVVVDLKGLRLTAIALDRPATTRPDLYVTSIEPLAPLTPTPAPAAALESARRAVLAARESDKVAALGRRLDAIAAGAAAEALIGLGEENIPREAQMRLARLIAIIEGGDEPALDWEPAWRDTLVAHPELLAELTLIGRGGRALTAELRGEAQQPAPDSATLQHLYDGAPLLAGAMGRLAEATMAFMSAWPSNRRLRVLLAGAPVFAHTMAAALPSGRCEIAIAGAAASTETRLDLEGLAERNDVRLLEGGLTEPHTLAEGAFDLAVLAFGLDAAPEPTLRTLLHGVADGGTLLFAELAPSAWLEVGLGKVGLQDAERTLVQAGWDVEAITTDGGWRLACATRPARPDSLVGVGASELDHWLVAFRADEASAAARLCGRLEARGRKVTRLELDAATDWLDPEGWREVWRKPDLRRDLAGFVYMPGLAAKGETAAAVLAAQDWRCLALLAAIRALDDSKPPPAFRLVTRGALGGAGGVDPLQAPLAGLGRVLQNERPELRCRVLDLPAIAEFDDGLAEALAAEALWDGDEVEVALDAASRWAQRLRPAPAARTTALAEGELERLHAPGGGLDNLDWVRQPRPAPDPGEVEVEVRAAGLNFRDVMFAMGALPAEILESGFVGPSLGMEAAGVISRVGEGVTNLKPGDRVASFGKASLGTYVVTRASAAVKLPARIGFAEGATLITAFFTVTYALERLAALERGERILIHGAAGGVGMAAVQYARHCGAEVFATAGTEEKREIVRLLGVADDHVLDSRSDDFAERIRRLTGDEGVDVVLNSIAGEAVHRGLSLLRPFGRFIELGKVDFVTNSRIGLRVFRNNIAYYGVDADELMARKPELSRQVLAQMLRLLEAGVYAPLPYRVFPRQRVGEAFRHMQRSRHLGKIVLDMTLPGEAAIPRALEAIAVDSEATYLVTGGLGGLGLQLAMRLAAHGARRLVLVSRVGTPKSDAQPLLEALTASGVEVRATACDVSDEAAVTALIGKLRAKGHRLKGVIHAAAVFDDAAVADQTPELFRRALAPKLAGGWALHRATLDDHLDLFLCISSISTTIGNPGQANYVAANLFLEALTQLRRGQGRAAQLMSLGPVADAGYLADRQALTEVFSRTGIRPLAIAEVLERFDQLLAGDGSAELLARVNWTRLAATLPVVRTARFHALSANGEDEIPFALDGDLTAMVRTLPAPEALELLQTTLVKLVAQILHVASDELDRDRSIFELGIDSLMGLELKMSIEERLGVTVSPMLMSQEVGIRRLAELVRDELLGEVEPPADTKAGPDAVAKERDYLIARHAAELDEWTIGEALQAVRERKNIRLTP